MRPIFPSAAALLTVAATMTPLDPSVWNKPEEEPESKGISFSIKPNSVQQYEFVSDTETQILAAVGGIGSGKTTALAFSIVLKMYAESGTGTYGGIFANTYRQLEQSTLPALWDLFEKMGLVEGRDYVYNQRPPRAWTEFRSAFKKHTGVLSVRAWGQAVVRSLENYNSIRGLTLGYAFIDELRDSKKEAFHVVLGRVRCPKALSRTIRIATSPNGFNWIYDELVVNAGDTRRVISMPTSCNPDLPEEYVEMLRASFTGRYAQQELDGAFISVTEGAVYHAFERAVHEDRTVVPIHDSPFLTFWDFNRNPFCVSIGQRQWTTLGERLVILDEVMGVDVGTEEMCDLVGRRVIKLNAEAWAAVDDVPVAPPPTIVVHGDPAGNQHRTVNNLSDYEIIARDLPKYAGQFIKGWRSRVYPVMESVNCTNALLKRGRFAVHPRCRKLILDLESVRWKEGTSEIDKEDKQLTHFSDGLRCGIAEMYPIRVKVASRIQT